MNTFKWIKRIFSVLVLFSILAIAYGLEFKPGTSSYSLHFRTLDCNNTIYMRGCRHEIGHKMDQDLGMPSQSPEFGNAVQQFLLSDLHQPMPSTLAIALVTYEGVYSRSKNNPGSPVIEIYAAIYAWSDGDLSKLPESLRVFYSSDPSYLKLYDCLAVPNQLNICDGRNFSFIKN